MKVICAGFPKTGTKSLAEALRQLGFVVYDFIENFWYLEKEWNSIFGRGGAKENFRRMFENVDAICDFPACYFCEELLEAFPDAKVILSSRESDSVENWLDAMTTQSSILSNNLTFRLILALTPTGNRLLSFIRNIGRIIYGDKPMSRYRPLTVNRMLMKKVYLRHYTYVLQAVPQENLLTFKCSEGWEPLCKFLGVTRPNMVFPHENIRGEVIEKSLISNPMILKIKRELTVVVCVAFACLSCLVYTFTRTHF
ncbi:uncharacterized protein LOC143470831 [Clavelina lepadiformis]|uniref:Sulfotransferase family protein n=1 Tax=Clavelina lepadiformis TaxID=159417 RepID=A0ABP0FK52_CLALP